MEGFFRSLTKVKRIYKNLGKREKFVFIAVVEGLYFFILLAFANFFWILFLISLFFVALSTIFALKQELAEAKYFVLLILPLCFWSASLLFARAMLGHPFLYLIAAILYGISRYSLFLTLNIYNVAAIRTIQLVRAAHAVGFLFTLLSAFFIYSLIWTARPSYWVLVLLVSFFSWPLILQSLWSIELENFISKRTVFFSLVLTLILAELALSFSFWPILPTIGALALVSAMYVLLGITHFYFTQRLKKRTVWEYLGIAGLILAFIIATTRWGG